MSDAKDGRGFEEIGRSIGALVAEKDVAYGKAFDRAGEVMRILFPSGIPSEKMDDALGLVRVLDKMFRIATAPEAFGEDPWKDIGGYGILGTARVDRRQRERRGDGVPVHSGSGVGERRSCPKCGAIPCAGCGEPHCDGRPCPVGDSAAIASTSLRTALKRWLLGWDEVLAGADLRHLADLAAATLGQMGEKISILNARGETYRAMTAEAALEREKQNLDQAIVVGADLGRRLDIATAKLDVAASRAADAVARFSGVEEQVRFEMGAAVRQAVHAALEPTHQSALAKLQADVQKADQRADRAAARATELERELERVRASAGGATPAMGGA